MGSDRDHRFQPVEGSLASGISLPLGQCTGFVSVKLSTWHVVVVPIPPHTIRTCGHDLCDPPEKILPDVVPSHLPAACSHVGLVLCLPLCMWWRLVLPGGGELFLPAYRLFVLHLVAD